MNDHAGNLPDEDEAETVYVIDSDDGSAADDTAKEYDR